MKCLAILVNYHCGDLLLGAVRSIAGDPACDRIHVVDNSASPSETALLSNALPAKAQLTSCVHNLGFANACNLAFESDDAESILLLNPDARLLPGALARMKATLVNNPRLGSVGPRVFWDDARQFLLPPTTFPSATSHALDRLSTYFPRIGAWYSNRFRAHALRYWRTSEPMLVNALSGGHVLLRRTAVEAAGGLFDPAFFMYWEDSDLMRRLKRAGYQLSMEPAAGAIHYYSHSSTKDALMAQGWLVYAAKYFDGMRWHLFERLLRHLPMRSSRENWPLVQSGKDGVLAIEVPAPLTEGWLLEFSPSPLFIPSMGRIGNGPHAEVPAELARRFSGRPYYLRLGSINRSSGHDRHFVFHGQPATD